MRRPTTPTPAQAGATTIGNNNNNNTGSRKVSPAISNVQRNRSPIVGASQPNHQQQQSLNIRNFSQVSQRQNQPPASSGSLTGTPLNTGGRNANNMQQHHQSHQQQQQQQTPTVQVNFPHYPPRSPRVPAGSTPNSARSASCINDLEGVIGEVMRERMNSLTESRKRVEELADLQRRETEMFLSSMEHILASSTVASTAQTDMMEDYEQRLGREKAEKGKMLDILQRFKSEGDRVTSDLKRALFDERDKHREATSKNEQLLSKVRELQGILNKYQQQVKELQQWKSQHQLTGGANASSGGQLQNNFPQTSSSSDNTFQKNNNEAQIFQLVEILKEHERVIDELERRNRNLEYDLKYQQNQKSRLEQRYSAGREGSGSNNNNNGISASSTTTTRSEEIHIPDDLDLDIDENNNVNKQNNQNSGKSLNSLIQQFASRGDQGASMSPDSLLAMTRGLLGQVRHENRNRLRVEEQYTSLVTDQDSQIRKLESRLRDYETIMQSNGINPNSNSNKSTLGSPSPARVVVAPNHNNNNSNNNTRQQQENANNNSTSTNTKSNHNVTTTSSLNQQQQLQQQQQQRRQPGGPLPTSSTNASNGPRLPTLTGVGSTISNPSGSNQNSGTNTPRTSSTNNNNINNQTGSSANVTAAPVLEQPNRQPMIGLDREDRDDVYLQNNNNHNKVAAEYEDDDDVPPSQPPPPTTRSTTTQRQNFRSTTEDDFEPEIRTNRIHSQQQQQQQPSGRQTSLSSSMPSSQENNNNYNNNKAPSVTVSELPSLEDQLNDVTNDFNLSLDMWNKAANGTATSGNNNNSNQKRKVRNDDEFQPDEI